MKTNEKLDKDRFRHDLGGDEEAYQEVARRLGLLARAKNPRCSTSTATARSAGVRRPAAPAVAK